MTQALDADYARHEPTANNAILGKKTREMQI
jgi:hypothetical protein